MAFRDTAQHCSPPAMLPLSTLPLGLQCIRLPTAGSSVIGDANIYLMLMLSPIDFLPAGPR